MDLDKYTVISRNDHIYEFHSEGPKGLVRKIIVYKRMYPNENIFNLYFGDWDEKAESLNDRVTSNNKDRDKILATVAATVLDFTARNLEAFVYAGGATRSRKRLYQMGIRAHWSELSAKFHIRGYRQGKWETFVPGNNCEAFVAAQKK